MPKPNQKLLNLPSSGIRKIMALSASIPDCIHLEVGQPDFNTPAHILEAAAQAARDGFTRYTAGAGIDELRQAVAEKVRNKNGFEADPGNIIISPGAVASIMSTLCAIIEAGDEVLVPDPGWPNYIMQIECLNGKAIQYPLDPDNNFEIDFDALENLISEKTKAIIINTPGNPTGAVFSPETMKKIIEFARVHDLYIISDEVYEDFVYDGKHVSAGKFDTDGRVISIYGLSKSYAATGMRIGCAVCEIELAKLITKLQEPFFSCASGISQKAYLAALNGSQEAVEQMSSEYKTRRDKVVEILKNRGYFSYTPNGAFYILINISSSGLSSDNFTMELLKTKKVAVAPGSTFGRISENFIRVSLATKIDDLINGVNRICDLLDEKQN